MRPFKSVRDSETEITRLLQYQDINGENRLFGGKLMAWIDEAATITAMRHCGGNVTTCSVDSLVFKEAALLNDILVLKARVTYVGNTSLEVRVDTFVERREDGTRRLINHAYLTEVCVDDEGHPSPVPWGLVATTPEQHEECAASRRRAEIRKMRRAEGV